MEVILHERHRSPQIRACGGRVVFCSATHLPKWVSKSLRGGFGEDDVPKIYFKKSPASFSVLMSRFCNLKVEMICRNSTFFLALLKQPCWLVEVKTCRCLTDTVSVIVIYCFTIIQIQGSAPPPQSWRGDRTWEARRHSVLILSPPSPPTPPPPPGFDWAWAQLINHCCLIQHEEKFWAAARRWDHPVNLDYSILGGRSHGPRGSFLDWTGIKLAWIRHPRRNVSTGIFTLHTLIAHCCQSSRKLGKKVTLNIPSPGYLWRAITAEARSPGYTCPPQRAAH